MTDEMSHLSMVLEQKGLNLHELNKKHQLDNK